MRRILQRRPVSRNRVLHKQFNVTQHSRSKHDRDFPYVLNYFGHWPFRERHQMHMHTRSKCYVMQLCSDTCYTYMLHKYQLRRFTSHNLAICNSLHNVTIIDNWMQNWRNGLLSTCKVISRFDMMRFVRDKMKLYIWSYIYIYSVCYFI